MGEISFNYDVVLKPKNELAFKYWFEESIEYSFAYRRYIASSDANIFNSPVAITKVATGLSQLYDLFVDKSSHSVTYFNLIHHFDKFDIIDNTYIRLQKQSLPLLGKSSKDTDNNQMCELTSSVYAPANAYSYEALSRRNDLILNKNKIITLDGDDNYLHALFQGAWIFTEETGQVYKDYSLQKVYENMTNVYKTIYLTHKAKQIEIQKDKLMAALFDNELNIYDRFALKKYGTTKYKAFKCKDIMLSTFDNHMDIYKYENTKRCMYKLGVNPQINVSFSDVIHINTIQQNYLQRTINKCNSSNTVLSLTTRTRNLQSLINQSATRIDNEAFYKQEFSLHFYDKPLCSFDIDTFTVQEKRYGFVIQSPFAKSSYKDLHDNKNIESADKNFSNLFINEDYWIKVTNSNLALFTSSTFKKYISNLNSNEVFNAVYREKYLSDYCNPIYSSSINNKQTAYYYSEYCAKKNNSDITIFDLGVWHYKDKKELPYFSKDISVYKESSTMEIQDLSTTIYKNRISMDNEQLFILDLSKNNKEMIMPLQCSHIYKDNDSIDILFQNWVSKDSHGIDFLESQMTIEKDSQMMEMYRNMQSFLKKRIFAEAPDVESVIKYRIPANYINILSNNFNGMIIPISKTRHQAYIDTVDSMVKKTSSQGYLNIDLSVSVIPKNSYVQTLDLFCDKQEHIAFLEYKNMHISKAKIYTVINKDTLVNKEYSYAYLEGSIWASKSKVDTFTINQVWAHKKDNKAQINDTISTVTLPKNMYHYNSLFVDKINQICYYDYGTTWADKSLEARLYNSQVGTNKELQNIKMLDCISPFIKKELDAFYDYGVFGNTTIRESALFKEIDAVQRTNNNCGIHPEDFGNWAWVYETPDPFDKVSYGIDELLLPENDTRYEDFEDIIFNKETMTPRNPVKQIDENTFIAKYPIRHPLSSKYANISVDYNTSAIDFENYYGIETQIMHTVFLKFYRIWQSKIFEFGTMTMVQSVKLMLEYLYSWIMEYFPLEKIEQALRVFKLIRWYGESSIIQNSQYIVSYEYGTLESKLNTGSCMIPNNIGPDNSTMLIDSKLGVIKNNPELLQVSNAYVEFYVNNKKNTTFTFSLSNTVGSVNIYINDVLVDTVSRSTINLTYELSYTGDINVVKIEKEKAHNLNATFYIGNIKVPNGTFKELSIDFDPTLKAGNKPLNEIARKMIAVANLYDNRNEAYETILKGNLGMNELYKKLTEYWELHHQGKTKGKRLTIKEV